MSTNKETNLSERMVAKARQEMARGTYDTDACVDQACEMLAIQELETLMPAPAWKKN